MEKKKKKGVGCYTSSFVMSFLFVGKNGKDLL